MTTLRISITKEVLEATKDCPFNLASSNCAISHAIRSIWPTAVTSPFFIHLYDKDFNCTRIEHEQKEFIQQFDRATPAERAAMQPFSFDIEVPDEVIGQVNIEEIRDIIKNSKTLELV